MSSPACSNLYPCSHPLVHLLLIDKAALWERCSCTDSSAVETR